jgi:hypothetical protein
MENFNSVEEALDYIAKNQRKLDAYNRKLEYIKKYQKEHADETKAKCKKYYNKLKDDEDKYKAFLEKKKMMYRIKKNLATNNNILPK